MNKYLVVILVSLGLTSCTTKDARYYQSHPKELQQAMQSCSEQSHQGLKCADLELIAKRMNSRAYELQRNPQGFGAKILTLQETIAKQRQQFKTADTDTELKASIKKNKQELAEYLAVVKWLESPAS